MWVPSWVEIPLTHVIPRKILTWFSLCLYLCVSGSVLEISMIALSFESKTWTELFCGLQFWHLSLRGIF